MDSRQFRSMWQRKRGRPSRDVSLIAQTGGGHSNMTGIGPFALSGGSASGSTLMLPGGSYNVTAITPGMEPWGQATPRPESVTVKKENSLTEVRLGDTQQRGSPVYNRNHYSLRITLLSADGCDQ